jgi:hypothetical protein
LHRPHHDRPVGGVKTFRALRWRTMVAFHKELRVSPTITAKSMFRNKIPETLRPGCKFSLCSKCGLFPLGCSGDSAMETTNPASKPSVGELFRIFRDDNPLCS